MAAAHTSSCGLDDTAVRLQLDRVLQSEPFRQSERQKRFLIFVVEEELAGRGERLNQFIIATEVFDRGVDFDPAVDSVVRVEARRLRTKLAEYYAAEGASEPTVISVPKGRYRVSIRTHTHSTLGATDAHSSDPQAMAIGVHSTEGTARPTIAVLPMDNLSGDPEQEYFSDGITEDIITDLSKISGLSVISRHSSFVYKGRSVTASDIGDDLGARYLLEGSVRRAGDRLRITAQLIDVSTDEHLWAERYDRQLKDIFAVQDDVTRRIVEALQVTLSVLESSRLGRSGTQNTQAQDLFMRAKDQFHRFTPTGTERALELLARATDMDSDYAEAFAWRSRAQLYAAISGHRGSNADRCACAVKLARHAVALDPLLPAAQACLGWALTWSGQGQEALAATHRALELDASFADGYLWRSMALSSTGAGDDALATVNKGIRLNPHYTVTYLHAIGLAHFALDQYDEALVHFNRAFQRSPEFLPSYILAASVHGLLGYADEAHAVVSKIAALDPRHHSIVYTFFNDERLRRTFSDGLAAAGLAPE